jgi:hypothetical protein
MALFHFLLVYDHQQQKLRHQEQFEDGAAAAAAYAAMERVHRGDKSLEIVLVGADSIETIKRTHANYFDGAGRRRSRRPAIARIA